MDTESAFSSINKTLNEAADKINSLDSDRAIYFPHRDARGAIDALFEDIGKIKKFIENRSVDAISELDHKFYVEMDAFIVAMQGMSAENIKLQNNYVIDFPDIVTLSDIFVYSDTFDAIMYDEYVQYLIYQSETGENGLTVENLRDGLEREGINTAGLTHEQLLQKYMECGFGGSVAEYFFRDSSDYRKYIAYGRPVDYKSIEDIQRQKDFWINLGIGVGITILSIVCPEIGVPLAFAYSGLMVGEAIYGKSIWTGRELSAEERWMDGIFGVFGMAASGAQLYKMYGTAANAARTLVNASEKYGFELSDEFIAKLGNNAIKNGDSFSAAVLNELAAKGNPAAIEAVGKVRVAAVAKMLESGSTIEDMLKAGFKIEEIAEGFSLQQQGIIDAVESGKTPLENTLQKGNYGEMKMDQFFESNGFERVSTDRITSLDAPTHQGIDGVYYSEGPPPMYAIAEAKYGTSTLSMTNDGLQMSDSWIQGGKRLVDAVGADMANELIADGYAKFLVHISPDGIVTFEVLP